jgi:hypothetical protein
VHERNKADEAISEEENGIDQSWELFLFEAQERENTIQRHATCPEITDKYVNEHEQTRIWRTFEQE